MYPQSNKMQLESNKISNSGIVLPLKVRHPTPQKTPHLLVYQSTSEFVDSLNLYLRFKKLLEYQLPFLVYNDLHFTE